MSFSKEQQQAIENFNLLLGYFKHNSIKRADFLPEYETCTKIINFLTEKNLLKKEDFLQIVIYYNEIIEQEHANGSGWFDFKLRLRHFFNVFSYESKWDNISDILTITKMPEHNPVLRSGIFNKFFRTKKSP